MSNRGRGCHWNENWGYSFWDTYCPNEIPNEFAHVAAVPFQSLQIGSALSPWGRFQCLSFPAEPGFLTPEFRLLPVPTRMPLISK